MRKWVGCFLAVLLVAITSLACVSRGTYQEAVQARDQLNQQLSTVTGERDGLRSSLSAANAGLSAVKADLEAARAELATANSRAATLQADLTKAQGDLRSLQQAYDAFNSQVKEAQKYWNVVDALLLLLQAQGTGTTAQLVQALGRVVIGVGETGNDQLVASWAKVAAALNTLGQDAALMDFLAVLGQKLAETRPQTK